LYFPPPLPSLLFLVSISEGGDLIVSQQEDGERVVPATMESDLMGRMLWTLKRLMMKILRKMRVRKLRMLLRMWMRIWMRESYDLPSNAFIMYVCIHTEKTYSLIFGLFFFSLKKVVFFFGIGEDW
jgi:hypothetical protein